MKCPICTRELDADAVFCAACGKKVPRCPTCGMILYERIRFCENDGTPLPPELFDGFPPEAPAGPAAPAAPASAPAVPPPQKKKGRGPLIAAVVLAAVLLLAAAGTTGYFIWKGELPFISGGGEKDVPASPDRDDDWDDEDDDRDNPKDEAPKDKATEEDVPEEKAPEEEAPADDGLTETSPGEAEEPEQQTGQAASVPTVPTVSMDAVLSVTASSYLTQSSYNLYHTPERMLDGDLTTAWVEGASGDGIGESVTFTFDGTYLVSGMRIYAGYQKSADLYEKNARPAILTVTFSDGSEQTLTLQDSNDVQDIALEAPAETGSVTLTIASVYPGSKYQDTVISEISFY